MAMSDEEAGEFGTRFPGRAYSKQIHRDGAPAEPATAEHEAWEAHEFTHRPPFITWVEFIGEAKKYFLTTETRDHTMKKLRGLSQKEDVERYITEFKGWAHLSGFDEIALVDQFKRGLKPALGRRVIETGNPGDGTTPGKLQKWYDHTTELERAFRESMEFFGRKEFTFKQKIRPANATAGPSKSKQETVTVKVKDKYAMDVDKTSTTCPPPKCYNCGKIGHIACNCKGKQAVQNLDVKGYHESMTEEEKEEMKRMLGFVTDQ